ncbi:MAG: alkaline phosphatase family protein [Chloroflexi bacterium]|nr:alkaline phosphatase family protein [Chloroflexota bacterium]
MNSPAKKAMVIGFDGASMELVKHMVDKGYTPNIAKLLQNGVYREMVGVVPTLTPPGWTTLATGAWAGTHRVTDFNIRNYESYIPDSIWGINTALCEAELIWNTAERCGKIPILVKQEISWPPTIKKGIQVEGTGPGVSNYHQIAGYHLFVTEQYRGYPIGGEKDPEKVDPSALQSGRMVDPIQIKPAKGWANVPHSAKPALEAELVIRPLARGQPRMLRGKVGTPKSYWALIYAHGEAGYNRLLVAPEKDAAKAFADLGVKDWSDWWTDSFVIDGEPIEGSVRCKLMVLSPDGQHVELFFPQIWPIRGGYTYPEEIAQELYEQVGPFLQNPARDALGLIDDDTYFEVLDYHFRCLAGTALYLLNKYDWDLFYTETHASDYASHYFLRQADPICGAPPEIVERSYQGLVRTYQAMDWWVGELMKAMDQDTVFLIVSDHGGTPDKYGRTNVEDVLAQAGLLVYKTENGKQEIDWSKTKACPLGICNIFLNIQGREPEGIIPPEQFEEAQWEVIHALMDYKHPLTGECPFVLALTRQDAEMLNLWGDRVGDVVFVLRPEYDAAHGQQMPSARLGIGGQHSVFIMAGAGVKKGVHLKGQVRQVDVAPTISYLLGMDVPRDAEGGVVYEALEDPNWHLTEIKRLMARCGELG